jgi:hypothetical protein
MLRGQVLPRKFEKFHNWAKPSPRYNPVIMHRTITGNLRKFRGSTAVYTLHRMHVRTCQVTVKLENFHNSKISYGSRFSKFDLQTFCNFEWLDNKVLLEFDLNYTTPQPTADGKVSVKWTITAAPSTGFSFRNRKKCVPGSLLQY